MKHNNPKQYAGVWLDNAKAFIITTSPKIENSEYAILETVKANEMHGGGSEHTMNNAKQADAIKYYKAVSGRLLNYDEVFLFGPGKAQEQFQNHLHEDPQFKQTKITIDSADQLTDPQMVAKVREFFALRQS